MSYVTRDRQYWGPGGRARISGVDELISKATEVTPPALPVDAPPTIETVRADLANLRSIMEKDLFWRRVSVGVAIVGTVIGAIKLTDIFLAVRRRRESS